MHAHLTFQGIPLPPTPAPVSWQFVSGSESRFILQFLVRYFGILFEFFFKYLPALALDDDIQQTSSLPNRSRGPISFPFLYIQC